MRRRLARHNPFITQSRFSPLRLFRNGRGEEGGGVMISTGCKDAHVALEHAYAEFPGKTHYIKSRRHTSLVLTKKLTRFPMNSWVGLING